MSSIFFLAQTKTIVPHFFFALCQIQAALSVQPALKQKEVKLLKLPSHV